MYTANWALCAKFLILLLILQESKSEVCNANALSSVDVRGHIWGHVDKYQKAITKKDVNFHLLENLRDIDVTRANVSQLCERMIRYFPKLESLTMISVNLSSIDVNAFENVPQLKYLSLSVNKINKIRKGAFNNLPSLKTLYLSQNLIDFIEPEAFSMLPTLVAVHLDGNFLSKVPGNLFIGCHNLRVVDFRTNNLKEIDDQSFDDLKIAHSHYLRLQFGNNRIKTVSGQALSVLGKVELRLERNEILDLDSIYQSLPEYSRLYLNGNKIFSVGDAVVEDMRNSTKFIDVRGNPLSCVSAQRIDDILGDEIYGSGELLFDFNCAPPTLSFD